MKSTNVEAQVRELFTHQAAGVQPGEADWGDIQVVSSASSGRRRPAGMLLAAAASVVLLFAIGWVVTRPGTDGGAGDGGNAAPAIDVSSPQVQLTADSLVVDVGGQQYSPSVGLQGYSDPGDATYQTLELAWQQHDTEMWLYLYFARDAATGNWSVTEIRVRDGEPAATSDWVTSTPGSFTLAAAADGAYAGTLDLQLTDGSQPAHLTITGMHLRPFVTYGPTIGAGNAAPSVTVVGEVMATTTTSIG